MFDLSGMLGIDFYSAKKVIDIILTAGTIWSILGVIAAIAGTGGIGVGIIISAKALGKRWGSKAAAIW